MTDEPRETAPAPEVAARFSRVLDDAARGAYAAAHGAAPAAEPARHRWRVEPRAVAGTAVALAVVAAVGWWGLRPAPASVPELAARTPSPIAASLAAALVIHVSGAVGEPGLVEVPDGARVADAIVAAGGLAADADEASVNLARAVADGEHVVVRALGEEPDGGAPVDLNTADAASLEDLPGIGPVLAARIVADREANGPFATVADLGRVSGVGDAILGSLAGIATVG